MSFAGMWSQNQWYRISRLDCWCLPAQLTSKIQLDIQVSQPIRKQQTTCIYRCHFDNIAYFRQKSSFLFITSGQIRLIFWNVEALQCMTSTWPIVNGMLDIKISWSEVSSDLPQLIGLGNSLRIWHSWSCKCTEIVEKLSIEYNFLISPTDNACNPLLLFMLLLTVTCEIFRMKYEQSSLHSKSMVITM